MFLEGTKILCVDKCVPVSLNGLPKTHYRTVETLRKGDLICTLMDGQKAIHTIGYTKIYNPGNTARSKYRLYKYTSACHAGLTDDLFLTGCHSVLTKDLTLEQRIAIVEEHGRISVTDDQYRLTVVHDDVATPHSEEGVFSIWHFTLENDGYCGNYGIYANGMLVETASMRTLLHQSAITVV